MRDGPVLIVVLACLVVTAGCKAPKATPTAQPASVESPAPPTVPSEQELGVPYYPGATPVGGGNTSDLVDAKFTSPDSIDKIVSFYKGNLRDAIATGDKNETMIEFKKDGVTYTIDLHRSQRDGVTLIQVNGRK